MDSWRGKLPNHQCALKSLFQITANANTKLLGNKKMDTSFPGLFDFNCTQHTYKNYN